MTIESTSLPAPSVRNKKILLSLNEADYQALAELANSRGEPMARTAWVMITHALTEGAKT